MSKKVGDKSELLTKVEMDRLLDVVAGDLYFTTLYRFLRYSGRRIGEIYGTIRNKKLVGGIKVKDINFEEDQIIAYILKTKKTKNKVICPICNVRNIITNAFCSKCGNKLPNIDLESLKYSEPKKAIISIQPEYKDILKLYISKNKLTSNDYIFREKSLSYLKKKVKKDASKAGIDKNFSLHGFRHYFITRCKLAGLSNDQIALWTGHVRPETINIYTHITPQDVIGKIRMVDL